MKIFSEAHVPISEFITRTIKARLNNGMEITINDQIVEFKNIHGTSFAYQVPVDEIGDMLLSYLNYQNSKKS